MIKKGLAMLLTFLVMCFVLQKIHILILEKNAIALPFSLKKNYLFNTGFSILVCSNIFLLSTVNKFKEQLGLVYLIALLIKVVLFFAIFYKSIVKVDEMQMVSKISMLAPLLIFLLTEVIFIAKQINQKS